MAFAKHFLLIFGLWMIYLIPAWVYRIPDTPWPPPAKKATITAMALISTGFSIYVILKPAKSVATAWIGNTVTFMYWGITILTARSAWRKLRQPHAGPS